MTQKYIAKLCFLNVNIIWNSWQKQRANQSGKAISLNTLGNTIEILYWE